MGERASTWTLRLAFSLLGLPRFLPRQVVCRSVFLGIFSQFIFQGFLEELELALEFRR